MSRHLTPLRYPGGKQRLAPFILEVLTKNELRGCKYVEPYAGGAGIAIELLLTGNVRHIHLNDSSAPVYAFWKSVTSHSDELCRRISSASLTVEEWRKRRAIVNSANISGIVELGFSTLYLNRCNRSGVLSGGLIGGIGQEGEWKMDARFSRKELIRRIEVIATMRDSITVTNSDAETFIAENIPLLSDDTFVYCDPPYFRNSKRLYLDNYNRDDHARLAGVIQQKLSAKWAVSYDGAAEILQYYSKRRHFLYDLQYSASKVYKGKEAFIFSDDLLIPETSAVPFISTALSTTAAAFRSELNPKILTRGDLGRP